MYSHSWKGHAIEIKKKAEEYKAIIAGRKFNYNLKKKKKNKK